MNLSESSRYKYFVSRYRPRIYILDRISRKSHDITCWIYISINHFLYHFSFLRSRIRKDISPYWEWGSMIPVDLSANWESWIYDPNGSGIQILRIRYRDPRMSAPDPRFRRPWQETPQQTTPSSHEWRKTILVRGLKYQCMYYQFGPWAAVASDRALS